MNHIPNTLIFVWFGLWVLAAILIAVTNNGTKKAEAYKNMMAAYCVAGGVLVTLYFVALLVMRTVTLV